MTGRVIQRKKADSLPLHRADRSLSTTLGHTQSTETTAGILSDLRCAHLSNLAGIGSLLDDNLPTNHLISSHVKLYATLIVAYLEATDETSDLFRTARD